MKENIPLQLEEEIKSIMGYEGLYSITSFGRIWSHEKIRKIRYGWGKYKAKFLKPGLNKKGYLVVILFKDNEKRSYLVSRFVAIDFILNLQNLSQVNHKDTNKQNNHISNLEWCTHQKNMNHASINGLYTYKKSSEYYGVGFHIGLRNKKKPWGARIIINKKQIYIGFYKTEIEGAKAYNDYVLKHNLNRPLNEL